MKFVQIEHVLLPHHCAVEYAWISWSVSSVSHKKCVCILKTHEGTKRLTLTAASPHLVGSARRDEDGVCDAQVCLLLSLRNETLIFSESP